MPSVTEHRPDPEIRRMHLPGALHPPRRQDGQGDGSRLEQAPTFKPARMARVQPLDAGPSQTAKGSVALAQPLSDSGPAGECPSRALVRGSGPACVSRFQYRGNRGYRQPHAGHCSTPVASASTASAQSNASLLP
jgi:hypothetical protein